MTATSATSTDYSFPIEKLQDLGEGKGRHLSALFDQYRLAVEMADKLSERRSSANTFFLSINTALLTAVGIFWELRADAPEAAILFPAAAAVAQCVVWKNLLERYRVLGSAKWHQITVLELDLLAKPFTDEYTKEVRQLGKAEQHIPMLFAFIYIIGVVAVIIF